jgi:hypothetical protein
MSPDIIDSGTGLGSPVPLVTGFAFGADSDASIKPVEVVFSGSVNILVFETMLDGAFHFNADALGIGLETLMTNHTCSISVSNDALVGVGNALILGIQVIVRLAFGTDFFTA